MKQMYLIKFLIACCILSVIGFSTQAQSPYSSLVWSPDLRNGQYKNPILYADYSDPDVCRVGKDYYMTASSFNVVPGLPILHSRDMINWTLVNHALPHISAMEGMPGGFFDSPQHGKGVWAPSIRHHNGEFYIYYGDPDFGIYMTKTKDPRGAWEPLTLVKPGKGLIDACPFWDTDGNAYLVHAYAGSRAGIKSLIAISRLSPDGKKAMGVSKVVYDGHDLDPTIEGPKFYKRNGYYYIFAPGGGVATGWQTVLRSKEIFGPYDRKVVLAQGNTPVNGPHQGAWVDTPAGEHWFFHFQDVGAVGRIVHLQPMTWKSDWPVIGNDPDGDGLGSPVSVYKKPHLAKQEIANPHESDEFNNNRLGLQWQWQANPNDWWYYNDVQKGQLSLFSVPLPENYQNLWDVPNLLLQKIPANDFTATTKIKFLPETKLKAERTGILIMGMDYGLLSFNHDTDGFSLSQIECYGADKQKAEKVNQKVKIVDSVLYLRVQVRDGKHCVFSYSTDGNEFTAIGKPFSAREGRWIGAKLGIFCSRLKPLNDGGRAEFDYFRITK